MELSNQNIAAIAKAVALGIEEGTIRAIKRLTKEPELLRDYIRISTQEAFRVAVKEAGDD